jgi:hypothetical protein
MQKLQAKNPTKEGKGQIFIPSRTFHDQSVLDQEALIFYGGWTQIQVLITIQIDRKNQLKS